MNVKGCIFLVLLLCFSAAHSADHPRLLISKADLPAFREKVKKEPYASMLKSLKDITGHEAEMNKALYGMSFQLRNFAALYLCTGDPANKDSALAIAKSLIANKHWWAGDYKGLTRQAYALAVALAYDAFYDAWGESDRKKISQELDKVADLSNTTMGVEANNREVSNWLAVRWGGCGVCWLACDEPGANDKADEAYRKLVDKHFKNNLGSLSSMGTNPEGYGYSIYTWQFAGPFAASYARLRGKKMYQDFPPAPRQIWAALLMTLYQKRPAHHAEFGIGLKPDWSDDHPLLVPKGDAGLSFVVCSPNQIPGLRWIYDRAWGANGDKLWDRERGNAIYSLLYYPENTESKNPAKVWGLTHVDTVAGMIAFRNQYKDENDILTAVYAKDHPKPDVAARGHNGRDGNGIRLWGLNACWITGYGRTNQPQGQSTLYPINAETISKDQTDNSFNGVLNEFVTRSAGDGSSVTTGSNMRVTNHRRMLAVDYSGKCGAPGLVILADKSDNGKFWRINTPVYNTISSSGNSFTITSPDGNVLKATVLHPSSPSFKKGTLDRSGEAFPFGTKTYTQNNWIQMSESGGDYLVVMTLNKKGSTPPSVSSTGSGINRSIKIGGQTAKSSSDNVSIDWPDDYVYAARDKKCAQHTSLSPAPSSAVAIALKGNRYTGAQAPGAQQIKIYSLTGKLLKSGHTAGSGTGVQIIKRAVAR